MDNWQQKLSQHEPLLHIHLLGIGGAGLSAIAQVLLELGFQVSGSDQQANAPMQRLAAAGVTIFTEQAATNLTSYEPAQRPDVVLISSAIGEYNPERQAAEKLGIPVVK